MHDPTALPGPNLPRRIFYEKVIKSLEGLDMIIYVFLPGMESTRAIRIRNDAGRAALPELKQFRNRLLFIHLS